MAWPGPRYASAALMAGLLATYATLFARRTFDVVDLPLFIGLIEWPVTLIFGFVIWAAWSRQSRKAALAAVVGMLGFYAVHGYLLFDVPLAFVIVTLLALAIIMTLPSAWGQGW